MADYRTSHLQRGETYDSTLSAGFDAYMAAWESRHIARIVGDLFPERSARYLDFACGTGRITEAVAPLCRSAVGVDISASMVQVARAKLPAATFHVCDLTKEDLDIGRFDLVTSFRFFGNAQPELRANALLALSKRISSGGYLLINSHRNPFALYAVLNRLTGGGSDGMDLHLGKLRRLLERHGFLIRHVLPIGVWLYRSRLLNATSADDPRAIANERRFASPRLAWIAPDLLVVAQRT